MKLSTLLGKPEQAYEKFNFKTKIKAFPKKQPIISKKLSEAWIKTYFKSYARFKEYKLPPPKLSNMTLSEALYKRRSKKSFSKKRLTNRQLSNLVYYSAGLKNNKPPWQANRFYPSGGARYPLEVYLISLNTQIPYGLYHYYLKNHSLEFMPFLKKLDFTKIFNQDWIKQSKCLIFITAVFRRMTTKYGDRGYRHILLEAGHLGQNIYLLSAVLELSCCAIGGFVDDEANNLLGIDGLNESAIYCFSIS